MNINKHTFSYSAVLFMILIVLITGFILGQMFPIDTRLPSYYGCNQIARWHADYLMREYGIKFYETAPEYSNHEINQAAINLNAKLLEICNSDPTVSKVLAPVTQQVRDKTIEYTVTPEDTLALIAGKFGVSTDTIKRINNLSSDKIIPGQTLQIPPG